MKSFQSGMAWLGTALLAGTLLFGACARPGAPSGGPPDLIPPMIATTWPDTFAVIEPTRDPVRIAFSERISERPTQGTLDQAVLVSPVTGEHRVKHTRSGLEIDVIGGFQPDLVYRVRVLPTVKDLFNNTIDGPFELVFSTGPDFERNVIAGMAKDRITAEAVGGVRVEARARDEEDPPVYVALTDSVGVFALRYLPPGPYDVALYQDVNRNSEPDFSELQGVSAADLLAQAPEADTVLLTEITLLRQDTTPARLIRVEALDSLTVRLAFDDYLDAESSLTPVNVDVMTEDSVTVQEVGRLLWPRQVDSLRAVNDSIAAEERRLAMVDSLQVMADSLQGLISGFELAGDTLGADSLQPVLEAVLDRMVPPEPPEEPEAGTEEEPPPILPQQEFFVLVSEPLLPDQLYRATISGVVNINGVEDGGGEASFAWEPPEPEPVEEPDTATVVADTAGVPPDTAGVPPDTTGIPPDTTGALPDTTGAPPDTTGVPPDTTGIPPDTTGIPRDTTTASPDTGLIVLRRGSDPGRLELRAPAPPWLRKRRHR